MKTIKILITFVIVSLCLRANAFQLPHSFKVEKYGNKQQVSFKVGEYSKPQLIFVWASWCTFCKDYTKVLQKYFPVIKSKKISVVAMSADEQKKSGSKESKKTYSQFETHYWLPEATRRLLVLEALPVMLLVDRNGRVDTIYVGSQSDKLSYFEKRLKVVLELDDES